MVCAYGFHLTLYSLMDKSLLQDWEKNEEAMGPGRKRKLLGKHREREREREAAMGMEWWWSSSQRLVDQNAEKVGRGKKQNKKAFL